MNHWLMKSEPNTYSWNDLVKLGEDHWDGVRNYQARNNMKAMKKGDIALFYHSVHKPTIVGTVEIVKEAYQDPTTEDDRWVVVDVKPLEKLANPVSLADVKSDDRLSNMMLVTHSRLSVQPVNKKHFDIIIKKSEK